MIYYAHSTETTDKSDWQPLHEHLENVGKLSEHFASVFTAGDWGRCVGILHDAGKACPAFVNRLEGKANCVDHATFGAQLAQLRGGKLGFLLAYVICGHHGGLPNGGVQEGQLHHRLRKEIMAAELLPDLNCSGPLIFPFELDKRWTMFSLGFFTRMLFSCLVDADYLDTESFYDSEKSVTRWALPQEDLNKLRSLLKSFISQKQATAKPSKVNEARHRILTRCISEAKGPQGFYSLTVPTGGGKTLSSLSFALEHAAVHDLSRVIYAIPFTSIIEQNAQVFRQAIGDPNVLEHHCNYHTWGHSTSIISNRLRGLATENWAAPVVVTTNVQFFESLYNNKPSRCRKLHNISGSVIILDEAQAIPTEFIEPCLLVLRELAANYRCTILFCTATQPALDNVRLKRLNLPNTRELVDEPDKLFEELERTRVEFIGKMTGDELARQLDKHQQALCIVSTKKQAQQVFVLIQEDEGSFHLSTNMYPVHRLRVLSAIRQRLADGLSCRVVSTSLVEAGVDFDFPVVYRAIAGLDSIAQAAGRCNREGLADYGLVYVYEPEELPAMPWLRRRISRAQETLRALPTENCLNPVSMHRYFELLYDVESLDAKDITKRMNPKLHPELIIPFQEVARDFRLIEDEGAGVIMPGLPEDRDEIHRLVEKLRHSQYPQSEGRILQRYAVAVRNMSFMNLQQKGVIELIHDAYPVMLNANAYDQNMGLLENMAELWDPEYLFL